MPLGNSYTQPFVKYVKTWCIDGFSKKNQIGNVTIYILKSSYVKLFMYNNFTQPNLTCRHTFK